MKNIKKNRYNSVLFWWKEKSSQTILLATTCESHMRKFFLTFRRWKLNPRNSQKVDSKAERCEHVYKQATKAKRDFLRKGGAAAWAHSDFYKKSEQAIQSLLRHGGEGGIWTLATILSYYSLSRGAPSASWVLLRIKINIEFRIFRTPFSLKKKMAEKVGFEPTVPCGITGFQDQLHKPLGHLSIRNFNAYRLYQSKFWMSTSAFFTFQGFFFFVLFCSFETIRFSKQKNT